MPETGIEDLQKRLALSERKRLRLLLAETKQPAEGDSFLWSLADLMTILLVFFILLFSKIDSSPLHAFQKVVQEEVSGGAIHRQKIVVPPEAQERSQPIPFTVEALPETAQTIVDNDVGNMWDQEAMQFFEQSANSDFYIRWDEERPVFVLGERITFSVGKAELLTDYQPILKKVAAFIASLPEYEVLVCGHTDNTPINTNRFPSNWELSTARAMRVAKFLIANDVAPERLTIQGQSQYKPLYENVSGVNKKANRRVELTLVKNG